MWSFSDPSNPSYMFLHHVLCLRNSQKGKQQTSGEKPHQHSVNKQQQQHRDHRREEALLQEHLITEDLQHKTPGWAAGPFPMLPEWYLRLSSVWAVSLSVFGDVMM